MELTELDDEGGPAAQSGSLTHEGVSAFHINQGTLEERKKAAWDAIASAASKFPLAEINEVRLFIYPYMNDPRNINAKFFIYNWTADEIKSGKVNHRDDRFSIERMLTFTLPPHSIDPTGKPIHVQGTYDQIRNECGIPVLYDLKTGKPLGWAMIHDYAVQQAAYVYGARQIPVLSNLIQSKLIRNHGYRTRENKGDSPDGVFWPMPWSKYEHIEWILENVRLHVALYRMGHIQFGPGIHCTYCDFGGMPSCMPKFEELSLRIPLPVDNGTELPQ